MGVLSKSLLAAMAVLALTGVPRAQPGPAQNPVETEAPSWLFVLHGEVAAVDAGRMTIAAGDQAVAFSDRPNRLVLFVDLEEFVGLAWGEAGEFRTDPPNAALIDEDTDQVAIIEITNATHANGYFAIDFTLLEGELPAPGEFVGLVIDNSYSIEIINRSAEALDPLVFQPLPPG